MLILIQLATADTLAWNCLPYALPEDWRPYATANETPLGEAALAAALAWIDADCWVPCDGSLGVESASCQQAVCTTEAGIEVVAWTDDEQWDSDSYYSSIEVGDHVLLSADEALALGFTNVDIEWVSRSYTSGRAYTSYSTFTAAWTGSLDAALPADAAFTASEYTGDDIDGNGLEGRSWSDSACTWSFAEAAYSPGWQEVVRVNGATLTVVHDVPCTNPAATATDDAGVVGIVDGEWVLLPDADGDTWPDDADCAPMEGSSHPCATEIACDALDQDCDGADADDADFDGYLALSCGGDDCDDTHSWVNPGEADERVDGYDVDCDGCDGPTDADADGHGNMTCGGDDCDDANASRHPGAYDAPDDGTDQDCDGADATADGDTADTAAASDTAGSADTAEAAIPDASATPTARDACSDGCAGNPAFAIATLLMWAHRKRAHLPR